MENTEPLLLTDDEMVSITGYKSHKKQITTLRDSGIPFGVNGRGKPYVLRSVLKGDTKPTIKMQPKWQPTIPM